MTDAHYKALWRILGKYTKNYDVANTALTEPVVRISATVDQIANQLNNELNQVLAGTAAALNAPLAGGPRAAMNAALNLATQYLRTATVIGYFVDGTSIPVAGAGIAAVLAQLSLEMTTDGFTITTIASTGLANFLAAIATYNGVTPVTIPTAGSPTYASGTYCVDAVLGETI